MESSAELTVLLAPKLARITLDQLMVKMGPLAAYPSSQADQSLCWNSLRQDQDDCFQLFLLDLVPLSYPDPSDPACQKGL